jgi:hypothetical protein
MALARPVSVISIPEIEGNKWQVPQLSYHQNPSTELPRRITDGFAIHLEIALKQITLNIEGRFDRNRV